MSFTEDTAVEHARRDLAKRLGVEDADIMTKSVADHDFPNTALGALVDGEMAGMMMSSGWLIKLAANSEHYEYRADKNQLRLHNFKGKNYVITS